MALSTGFVATLEFEFEPTPELIRIMRGVDPLPPAESLRGTGRTSRMLERAVDTRAAGLRPIVVGLRQNDIGHMLRLPASRGLGAMDFRTLHAAIVYGKLRGTYRENVFIDHLVWDEATDNMLDTLIDELNMLPHRP